MDKKECTCEKGWCIECMTRKQKGSFRDPRSLNYEQTRDRERFYDSLNRL